MPLRLQTVPNAITALRILILPPLAMALEKNNVSWAVSLLSIAILSDFLDGFLARRFRQESDVGKLMDPVADKILVCVLIVFLVGRPPGHGPALNTWLAILLLAREFFISALRALAASVGFILPAGKIGKYKAAFQFAGLALFMLGTRPFVMYPCYRVGGALLWTSVVLSYWSMTNYSIKVFRVVQSKT
jgi:CDP-diacylglycerol--glycerol-3-phosphate 3-phosphatidyltransferase